MSTDKRAYIRVKVARVPGNGNSMVHMYFGNAGAKYAYDPAQVFDLYDDVTDIPGELNMTKWPHVVNTIYPSISNGDLMIVDAAKSTDTHWIYDTSDSGSQFQSMFDTSGSSIVEWKTWMYCSLGSEMGQVGIALVDPSNNILAYIGHEDSNGALFNTRVKGEDLKGGEMQVCTDGDFTREVKRTQALLEKYADAELDAGDTEQ